MTDADRFNELRELYKDDQEALRQIDVYDPSTEYHLMITKYRDSLLPKSTLMSDEEWRAKNG